MTRISEAVECLESLGYTVTPPAAPPIQIELPREPGLYEDVDGDVWMLDVDHEWHCLTDMHRPRRDTSEVEPVVYAPFTRLEPVPVTAKKVLKALMDDIHPGHMGTGSYGHVHACITHVLQQFGVTE